MRFLRLTANGLICGLAFCFLLALLVLDLNINLRPSLLDFPKLAVLLFPTYGLIAALAAMLTASIYRFFVSRPPRKGLLSPRFIAFGLTLLTLLFLAIFRENSIHFAVFFTPVPRRYILIQMALFFLAAAAGLVLLYRYYHGKRKPVYLGAYFAAAGAAYVLAVAFRLAFPAAAEPQHLSGLEAKPITRRVTILNLEGLSFDFILPLANDRLLPNFTNLMENGAWGYLQGFTPSDSVVLRRTLKTGKLPGKHRRLSDVRYAIPGFGKRLEVVPRFILFRQLKQLGFLKIEPYDPPPAVKDIETIYGAEQGVVLR